MNVKILSILLISFLFTGCVSLFETVKPIDVKVESVQKTKLALDNPKPLKLNKIQWFVITPEIQEQTFQTLNKNKYDEVLFGLTDDGYKALSLNIAELKKYIIEQNKIIKSYKDYYETDNGGTN